MNDREIIDKLREALEMYNHAFFIYGCENQLGHAAYKLAYENAKAALDLKVAEEKPVKQHDIRDSEGGWKQAPGFTNASGWRQ